MNSELVFQKDEFSTNIELFCQKDEFNANSELVFDFLFTSDVLKCNILKLYNFSFKRRDERKTIQQSRKSGWKKERQKALWCSPH